MRNKTKKVVVITGASSGIGNETAKFFLEKGCVVYGLSRRKMGEKFFEIECDVTNSENVKEVLEKIFLKEGRIDVFVNNAGIGISGAVEHISKEKEQKLIDVNISAVFDCCRQVIPYLKQNGGGKIINISSMAAVFPIPFQAVYSASKAAINNFSNALRIELESLKIAVVAVMPGDTKTNFTIMRDKVENEKGYEGRISKSISKMEKDEQKGTSPKKTAKVIFKLAKKKNSPPLVAVGAFYKIIAFFAKIFPQRFVLFLIKKLYG